jgi:hypothetical protein
MTRSAPKAAKEPIRAFLEAARAGDAPASVPADLGRFARAIARKHQGSASDARDLAADFVLAVLARVKRRGPASLDKVLDRDDVALRKYVRGWMKHVSMDRDVRALERHSLEPHVRKALREPRPAVVPELPCVIVARGRFKYELVRDAVAHLVARGGVRPEPDVLTRELLSRYFRDVELPERPIKEGQTLQPRHKISAEDAARIRADGPGVAQTIVHCLGYENAMILGLKAQGRTDKEVGELVNLDFRRVNERYKKAVTLLRGEFTGTQRTLLWGLRHVVDSANPEAPMSPALQGVLARLPPIAQSIPPGGLSRGWSPRDP